MPAPPISQACLSIPDKLLAYHCSTNAVSYKTSAGRGGWVPLSCCLQQERSWFLSCPQKKKVVLTQRAWSLSHLPALLIYQPSPQREVNTKGGKQRAAWRTQSLHVLLQGCILLPLFAMPCSFPQQPSSASSNWRLWRLCWCFSVQQSFGTHNFGYRNCGYLL